MKFRPRNTGPLRGFLALSVSVAVIVSNCAFAVASYSKSTTPAHPAQVQTAGGLLSAEAIVTESGVRIEWRSSFDIDNLGFNVYRVRDGKRTRLNREIIPGSVFVAGPKGAANGPRGVYQDVGSHGWLDRSGTADSVYYIESVSQSRTLVVHEALVPVAEANNLPTKQPRRQDKTVAPATETVTQIDDQDYGSFETSYPAITRATRTSNMMASTIENQWSIAGQVALKIGIKKDGWYRVTQPQMAAAGFNPVVDVRNLQLFVGGQEVAISTSQSGGTFGASDYIEFFGRGLDVPTTDVRTYYLVASSAPGKRVGGELQIESLPPNPQPGPLPPPKAETGPGSKWSNWVPRKLVISSGHPMGLPVIPLIIWGQRAAERPAVEEPLTTPGVEAPARPTGISPNLASVPGRSPATVSRTARRKSRKQRKPGASKLVNDRREYSHAVAPQFPAPSNFSYTVERKDRTVHFSGLINGEAENFFGQVIATNPASQTINTPNRVVGPGSAKLEIKLQGVSSVEHQVSVSFNDVAVGSFNGFYGHQSLVKVLDVPLSLLQNGANTVKFTPAVSGDVTLVDYARITYPHAFTADADALKFSLLGTQSLQVDGFQCARVHLVDYTDPLNVILAKPEVAPAGGGYAITVPSTSPKTKTARLLYATCTPPEQAALLTLNQPSALNVNTNAADFLIITTSSLAPDLAPLVAAREAQGMNVEVVDVEDVFDEFSYGVHGPQAVKDFLARANSVWATKPKYIVFAGDASYDPRNYLGFGSFDLVPTKLVDATYNETASDDSLADFNDDGIADVPVGRLPVRSTADAILVVSKILNFTPLLPENAMLVADDPTGYYFNFEQANDQVQALLPPAMAVQRVNVRVDGPATAKTNVIAGFNQGRALVNYTGHGNVDVWSGSAIFKSADATALTNGNRLSFVIVMDCLNGYYHSPGLLSMAEAFLSAPGGGAVAVFASSGLTLPDGQHQMSTQLYSLLFGAQPIALGDAIKIAKGATNDIDVRRTWIFFGDPSMKIR